MAFEISAMHHIFPLYIIDVKMAHSWNNGYEQANGANGLFQKTW